MATQTTEQTNGPVPTPSKDRLDLRMIFTGRDAHALRKAAERAALPIQHFARQAVLLAARQKQEET